MNTSLYLLMFVLHCGNFQNNNNIKQLVQNYEQNLNSSLKLDKEDRNLMNSWATEFQLKRINVTTKYRIQVNKHKEHSFQRSNAEWIECVYHHRKPIRKSYRDYMENESGCLTTTSLDDADKVNDVKHIEKEMKKWRKGYKYLLKSCRNENPNDEDAAEICLVEFMEKDNYNTVIQRLIILKLEAMGRLYLHLDKSIKNLEECLNNQLSEYLDKVRFIREALNRCYEIKTKNCTECE